MSSSSQNLEPVGTTQAFVDLAAAIDPSVSSDQAADLLYAFRIAVRAQAERDVRNRIAADFEAYGKQHSTLSWGQARYIARDGLCSCSGGSMPCDEGGAR
ncbi:hypothetical protein [Streptomyces canus]|uniref:hypothetical protein n=1 Tax=Streptomyces canus TaxID=58343 RepID=UPI00278B69C6|nr:hypothetical protein [Streptomyces canus]MDQ0758773.1 hypothetical protein [Streptomyces canus]